ncbi:MAG: FHA domain-containing protein [Proteobacteria bacterium]|nr:MAG: FHA domain-containing protein [Pseudomonadota bacterium]
MPKGSTQAGTIAPSLKGFYNNYMVLYLEILDGQKQGARFALAPGLVIGRSEGSVVVNDPKISSRHALVELDNKQQFVLLDLNSSNGIMAGSHRVKRLAMMPGVKFKLGRTQFLVIEVHDEPVIEVPPEPTWKEVLAEKLPLEPVKNRVLENLNKTFSPAVRLHFVQGIQTDEQVYIGYGPRTFGAHHLDFDLKDPQAPEVAFQLVPDIGRATLVNHCRDKLTLNNKPVTTSDLLEGDLIRFGGTVIKVTYV